MPANETDIFNNQDGRPSAAVPVVENQDAPAASGRHAAVRPRPSVKGEKGEESAGSVLKRKAITNVRREQERRSKLARRFALIICFVAVFCLGFFLRGFEPLMNRIDPTLAASTALQQAGQTATTFNSLSARVSEVEKVLADSSPVEYDLETVTNAVVKAFADSADDPYLTYFNNERYATYVAESTSSDYTGVGVLFAEYGGKTYAADVFPGSGAAAAGVQVGDYVQAIGGNSAQDWTPTEVVNALNANVGQDVVITWLRPKTTETGSDVSFSTTLPCKEYKSTNVAASMQDQNVGLIKITQLSSNASDLVKSAITSLTAEGATSFILDLRDCSGGFLSEAVDIASMFAPSGTMVQIQTKEATSARSASTPTLTELPLVVLVNSRTAAAAEVLAAALRDNDRGNLVGTTTMGKGSVQVIQQLSFGGALRYTAAYYLTPLGHSIDGQGLTPDVQVSAESDQMSVALQIASSGAA
ncbi:MAG: S41 family peptidase [Coriobacteriia bacterium]|nr:S41 family peptidase [Coriobacteriia bacterium]